MGNTWQKYTSNELAHLSDGIQGKIQRTKAVKWIHKKKVPERNKFTYVNMICDFFLLKEEKYKVRLTIGGDRLDYHDETASPTANILDNFFKKQHHFRCIK